ncbi:FKBP-type peptidyl-prolyl cis-trans isomerase [Ekhidna sp. MALMAid0563]|uniref:FKBP-type peptidyl-prolyl cis-trans isomerase n=1 Tax=Ekhidna sp. MALMAid0563 TaxID=3143937 RepID=UPI0032DE3621
MRKGFLAIVVGFILLACGDGNVVVQVDPDIQFEKDSIAIAEFMEDKGYDNYQFTSSGVSYIILDNGSGDPIDESDFVTFDYTGMLLSDTIFDTSVKSVGDSIRTHFLEDSVGLVDKDLHEIFLATFSEERSYNPLKITYSSSGWTIEGQFINGFTDGVSATFHKMNVGGRAIIAIPSGLAYGTSGSGALIPPNTPIAFELMPVEVIKQ